ncbi:MAG: hypothetical protein KDB69_07785, partial [Acidimicrobiia bacterium]|nr:hypothetical protein [Acidimicrobiia bacterium]
MRSNRWIWVGVYLVATAVLAAGVAVLVRDQDDRDAKAPTARLGEMAPMPFASSITPVGATSGRVGDTLFFQTQGYTSDEVVSVELWDGGSRVETQSVDGGTSALVSLPALSVGPHAVYAKVIDAAGQESLTAPTTVDIVANGTGPVAPVEVSADDNETVEHLARRLDVDIDRIAVTVAGQGEASAEDVKPLSLGPADVIPVDAIVSAQPDGDEGLEAAISAVPKLPDGEAAGSSKGDLSLTASAEGCAVVLGVAGASGTVDLWDGAGANVGWLRVAQREGSGKVTIPAVSPGVHLYFATAGADQTTPIAVTMPATCTKALGWTGDVSITDGILTVNRAVPNGRLWLYLQVDGGTAVRVPAEGSLPAVGPHTDIGSLLPPLEGSSLTVELWHGDEFLDRLVAKGSLEVPDGGSITDVVGESRMLQLKLTDPTGPGADILGTQDRKLTFTWSAGPRIEAVLFQVLVDDHPITQTTLPPNAIIATGVAARSAAGTTGSGTFTVDTATIPGRAKTGRDAASAAAAYPAPTPQVIGTTIAQGSKPVTVTPINPGTVARQTEAPVLIDLPSYGEDVWVRAIGLIAGSGVTTASNTVRIRLPVPQGVNGTGVDFVSGTDFGDTAWTPGHLPVRSFENCVWADVGWNGPVNFGKYVDRSPHGQISKIEAMSVAYPDDGTYCPKDFPPPPPPSEAECGIAQVFCDFWDGVVEFGSDVLTAIEAVYTFVSTVMSTVVSKISKAVAKYSGVCGALEKVASGSEKTCGAVLEMATNAAISAVLASVGVP